MVRKCRLDRRIDALNFFQVYFEDNAVEKRMVEVPISRTITELTRCPG